MPSPVRAAGQPRVPLSSFVADRWTPPALTQAVTSPDLDVRAHLAANRAAASTVAPAPPPPYNRAALDVRALSPPPTLALKRATATAILRRHHRFPVELGSHRTPPPRVTGGGPVTTRGTAVTPRTRWPPPRIPGASPTPPPSRRALPPAKSSGEPPLSSPFFPVPLDRHPRLRSDRAEPSRGLSPSQATARSKPSSATRNSPPRQILSAPVARCHLSLPQSTVVKLEFKSILNYRNGCRLPKFIEKD